MTYIPNTGTDITRVQPGSNVATGGTGNFPIVSIVASPSLNNITASGNTSGANVSGTTFYSGGTPLTTIITNLAAGGSATTVQPGANIQTGGTPSVPVISTIDSPSFNNGTFSGNTIASRVSGTTFFSGGTNLATIISSLAVTGGAQTGVIPGTNIQTGGTFSAPIVFTSKNMFLQNLTLSGTGSFNGVTATTFNSSGAITSGGTDLYSIFSTTGGGGAATGVIAGTNITTGGTFLAPIINVSPSIYLVSMSADTVFSGATNLYQIFESISGLEDKDVSSSSTLALGAGVRMILTGATVTFPAGSLKVGTQINFKMHLSKTAAGTTTNLFGFHISPTSGITSASTMVSCFSGITQTAVVDDGVVTCDVIIRGPITSSCIAQTLWTLNHTGSAVGLANRQTVVSGITSTAFDATTAQAFAFSVSGGTSTVLSIPLIFCNTLF